MRLLLSVIAFFLLLFGNAHGQINIEYLENGDLIFQNGNCGSLCIAINSVTPAINGKHFSHVGIIEKKEDQLFVLEATSPAVQKVSLEQFLLQSEDIYLIGRLKDDYQNLIPEAINFSKSQIGIPYDWDYLYDNGKYYCSELIYDAFKSANNGKDVFYLEPMTFKEPGSDDFFSGWLKYYNDKGMEIPEGALGCNPGSLGNSEKLDIFELNLD